MPRLKWFLIGAVSLLALGAGTSLIVVLNARGIASLALLPTIASAHGGEEHVTGTVTKIFDTSVTVKTTQGKTVEVSFDAKMTTYERAKQPIQKTDIKVGDRIVIHAMKVNEKLVAHSVEVGATSSPAKH